MEPVETDGGLQVTDDEPEAGEHAVVATLRRVFTGLRVGFPTLTVQCSRCETQLGEGEEVSVYAYRIVETPRWYLARCPYIDCAPDDIAIPTLGAMEVRVRARLAAVSDTGTQHHRLGLADPVVNSILSPQEGKPP